MVKLEQIFKTLSVNIFNNSDIVKNHCESIIALEKLYNVHKEQITLSQLLSSLHEDIETSSTGDIKEACFLIIRVQEMDNGERDTIKAIFENGPLFDGDVPSKNSRDKLVKDGFIDKIVVKGEEGYNACTYKGSKAYRLIKAGACG